MVTLWVLFLCCVYSRIAAGDQSVLEDWCYSPAGTDCRWYKECLVKRYSCEEAKDSYAIGFGDSICNLFTSQQSDFSDIGQRWINSTKACLQKILVPVLTSNVSMTCPEIQTYAFHTHTQCYTEPLPGTPSFCELPFQDWLRVTWIVKQSFIRETAETVRQVTAILGKCAHSGVTNLFG